MVWNIEEGLFLEDGCEREDVDLWGSVLWEESFMKGMEVLACPLIRLLT